MDSPATKSLGMKAAFRIGYGYDAHTLVEGRPLILGGVRIPSDRGLLGHSDADVLLHALCDAILGAASLGDLGTHFPDTDSRWKGVSSIHLLEETNRLARGKGWKVGNVDSTVCAQQPRLAPYIPEMVRNIAQALRLEEGCVGVKATTTEGMGFVGRGEGIAAHAVVLLTPVEDETPSIPPWGEEGAPE